MKHIVGFSGGIDSQACLAFVRDKFGDSDVIALNSNVGGHEHPLTTEFVREFSMRVFPITEVTPVIADLGSSGTRGAIKRRRNKYMEEDVLTFDRMAEIKGVFPSRQKQFCTTYLKLAPQLRWQKEYLQGVEFERYSGVRCDESEDRKKTLDRVYDTYFECHLNYPIRCWTKTECFAFIKSRGEKTNPLYEMGFSRIGCSPCVNSSKNDIRVWAARCPEGIEKIKSWETSTGKTFFMPMVPGLKINWIDQVVAWSRTVRGGKQIALQIVELDADLGMCSSVYGLCE